MLAVSRSAEKRQITADVGKCNGCLLCQFRCSYRFEKNFNPLKAAISINRLQPAGLEYGIRFGETCDACGLCAQVCHYGALTWSAEGRQSQ